MDRAIDPGSMLTPTIVASCALRLVFGASYPVGGVTQGGSSKRSANGRIASMFTRKSAFGGSMMSRGAGFCSAALMRANEASSTAGAA